MRPLLRYVVFSGSLAAAVMTTGCTEEEGPAATQSPSTTERLEWEYAGERGPAHWGRLSKDYAACSEGVQQSPLDLSGAQRMSLQDIVFNYGETAGAVVNTGHSIQVDLDPGNTITLDDAVYELRQFHFHTPSEHAINGVFAPLEAHFVHRSDDGKLAVVGILIEVGTSNLGLESIFGDLPSGKDAKIPLEESLDLRSLLPSDRRFYSYTGSLTTPPCTEGVKWHVLSGQLQLSADHLEAFTSIFPLNARPLQPLGARELFLDTSP